MPRRRAAPFPIFLAAEKLAGLDAVLAAHSEFPWNHRSNNADQFQLERNRKHTFHHNLQGVALIVDRHYRRHPHNRKKLLQSPESIQTAVSRPQMTYLFRPYALRTMVRND